MERKELAVGASEKLHPHEILKVEKAMACAAVVPGNDTLLPAQDIAVHTYRDSLDAVHAHSSFGLDDDRQVFRNHTVLFGFFSSHPPAFRLSAQKIT